MSSRGSILTGMRISELAERTGLPVATIKFYLREGLVPPGRRTAPNQARYGDVHVQRIRLLRLLREVADVPVERLRTLARALDDAQGSPLQAMTAAADALAPSTPAAGPLGDTAKRIGDRLIAAAGWTEVRPDAPDRENLRAVLEVIIGSGTHEDRLQILDAYATAADRIARFEVEDLDAGAEPDALLSQMVVGQVVFGALLATLRRLAEEHHATRRFSRGDPTGGTADS